ncbi:hypothetical protein GCM10023231_40010 [Olivibacter ginsenosidimutans]|uniref:Uncharacterized protein n=1 Tax=Olivibacter ginsenosidimutans TaxID=1176537 RepID=A0ABP9CE00_9SPHI
MTLEAFKETLTLSEPPVAFSVHLKALWYDAKGNWQRAHDLIDQLTDAISAHVHAYLHRKEGDRWNAQYWYNRADQPMPQHSLDEEWEDLFYKLRVASC